MAAAASPAVPDRWPTLTEWTRRNPNHPLRVLRGKPSRAVLLDVWEQLLCDLQQANPARLASKRKNFSSANTIEECLQQRAEFLVATHLTKAEIAYEFLPEGGVPQPDIALLNPATSGLRIEVTSRQTPSLEELRDELDMDLEGAGYQVEIQCEVAPVRISDAERESIRANVRGQATTGKPFRIVEGLKIGYPPVTVDMVISGVPAKDSPEEAGEWVTYEVAGAELTDHMREVEMRIVGKLTEDAKNRQAAAAPTLLLVEASRTGLASIRPDWVWEGKLQSLLGKANTNFVAIGVLFADQASLEARAVVVRGADCPSNVVAAIDQVREAFRPTPTYAQSPKQLLAYAVKSFRFGRT